MRALPAYPEYRVAAIQFDPGHGKKERNIRGLSDLSYEAAENGARLIVLPEMATTGYCWYDRAEVAPFVEPIPGPTTDRFGRIAADLGCYIAVGLPEVDPSTNIYYNALAFIGPRGVIGAYRKTHANIAEPRWARDGDAGFPVWETELGNIAGLICMDFCYFEPARIAALEGCDVIAFAAGWLDIKAPSPLWISAAFENGVYVIAADTWGCERGFQFSGGSCILNPDGTVQDRRDVGDGIVYGEVDVRRARDKRFRTDAEENRFSDRRPAEYLRLVQNTYLWDARKFHDLYHHAPLPAGRRSKVTVAQFRPEPGDVRGNIDRMEGLLAGVDEDSELAVFPELSLTGPIRDRGTLPEMSGLVEPLIRLAVAYRTYLVTSLPEEVDGVWYHTALVAGPEGISGRYRKVHLGAADRTWAAPGDLGFPTFDLPVGRVGLLVGYDILFPESSACLAAWGCDLICVPSALRSPRPIGLGPTEIPFSPPIPRGQDPLHFLLWRVRAEQASAYLAFSNYCGDGYAGRSGVFGPELEVFPRDEVVLSEGVEEVGSLVLDLTDPGCPARVKDAMRMRQVHLYERLVRDTR